MHGMAYRGRYGDVRQRHASRVAASRREWSSAVELIRCGEVEAYGSGSFRRAR